MVDPNDPDSGLVQCPICDEIHHKNAVHVCVNPDPARVLAYQRHQYALHLQARIDSRINHYFPNHGGQHGNHRQAGAQIHGSPGPVPGTLGAGSGPRSAHTYQTLKGAVRAGAVVTEPSSDPPTIQDTGVEVGEVTAYRCWKIDYDTGLLRSIVVDEIWEPGVPMQGKPSVPDRGVHAFKSELLAYHQYGRERRAMDPVVWGTINLWGKIYQHSDGYRAEFGIPYEIHGFWPETWDGVIRNYDAYFDRDIWASREAIARTFDRLRGLYNHAGMLPAPPPIPDPLLE